jgi:AcrR family transcriptional regulator
VPLRTFFRYFPTKEDVVLWDEYDPLLVELLEARPPDEPPAVSARALMRENLAGLYRRDSAELLTRIRLLTSVPELRARFLEVQGSGAEQFASILTQRRSGSVDELEARVVASAVGAAVVAALDLWQRDDGKSDLLDLFDRAAEALVAGLRKLDAGEAG